MTLFNNIIPKFVFSKIFKPLNFPIKMCSSKYKKFAYSLLYTLFFQSGTYCEPDIADYTKKHAAMFNVQKNQHF